MPVTCVISKSYIKAHTRRLPSGRTITIQPHFDKRVPKGKERKTPRTLKHGAPPEGVYAPLHHEHLTARLLRHVHEGKLTHAEAHANLDHLERRANAGHHLEHGHGPSWTPEQTHEFIYNARAALHAHQQMQEHEAQAMRIEALTGAGAPPQIEQERPQRPQGEQGEHRPERGITYAERQAAWDAHMRQRQAHERERMAGIAKSLPRLVLLLKKAAGGKPQ